MADRVYLDWNATAPLRVEAREAMIAAMDVVGNPSRLGRPVLILFSPRVPRKRRLWL